MQALEQFKQAMAHAGLPPPDAICPDGAIHRFSTNGKKGDTSGWYVFHADGIPAGAFGDWRQGLEQTWSSKERSAMSPEEWQAHQERMQAMQTQREAELAQRQAEAAQTARQLWDKASPCAHHPYLTARDVQGHGVREFGGRLLIPLRDGTVLQSLQAIAEDGTKRFHPGGKTQGCYHAMGKPEGRIVVCEGYATGASIHEATGWAVACAMTANNLLAVARALHAKYPTLQIVLAADDDWRTAGNPGVQAATEAAQAVGGLIAMPQFGADRPEAAKDFNDLHQLLGAEAVRACLEAAAAPHAESEADAWPDPDPLAKALPDVQPFDLAMLPEGFRAWVSDISHRMQQPADFAAVGAIVCASALIGARAAIHPKQRDDWQVVPVLWGALVGRASAQKSPVLKQIMAPIHGMECRERERWQAEHESWKRDCELLDMQDEENRRAARKAVKTDQAKARRLLEPEARPERPVMRRFVVMDSTVEALGELLAENPWGLLVFRDELTSLLASMDQEGHQQERGFYLTAYDGNQGYTVNRIARGEVRIPRACLAMLGGIQPAKLQGYVRDAVTGGAGDDGLMQRFSLAVWPDQQKDFTLIDRWPDTDSKQAAYAIYERLAAIEPQGDEPRPYRFDGEAQALFYEWLTALELELRSGDLHPAMESHLGKYRKLIPALALIFALIDTPDSPTVGKTELLRALAWGDYLRSHAERIYSAATRPDTSAAHVLLSKLQEGGLPDGFRIRDVQQKGWAMLDNAEAIKRACKVLEDHGWIRMQIMPPGTKGGRPSETCALHPSMKTGGQHAKK